MAQLWRSILCSTVLIVLVTARPQHREDQNMMMSRDRSRASFSESQSLSESAKCKACRAGASLIRFSLYMGLSDDHIASAVVTLCKSLEIEDSKVCRGATTMFKTEVLTVLKQTTLTSEQICALVLGICSETGQPELDWRVVISDKPKPPVKRLLLPKPGSPTVRILQLSDAHLDPKYKPGSSVTCKEPLCCRTTDETPSSSTNKAGYWGEAANCDVPTWTFTNMLQHLAKEKFDFIYWTGDLPAHNVWDQSEKDQINLLGFLFDSLEKYFPGIPVYSALGNHESVPVDSFPPPFINGKNSIGWLYERLAKQWSDWVPKTQFRNILHGAYYTLLLKPGFRLVSINTNYCNRMNIWLLLNTTDPSHELQWLSGVLQAAENNNEKVHIIGHIPPGYGDCYTTWTDNYHTIVNRYESTITGQFFGHTHWDHFELFYDRVERTRPVSVAYIAPSITTFQSMLPGYRTYTADGLYPNSTWQVLDHETHIMNLTEANAGNFPVWKKEYSARSAYRMPDLFPASWDKLVTKMKNSTELFNTFYKYYSKSHVTKPCDEACRATMICSMKTSISRDTSFC